MSRGWNHAERLRGRGFNVEMYCGEGGMKNQMKRADKSGALIGLLLGENELESDSITLKMMQRRGEQVTVAAGDLVTKVQELIGEHTV